jgi:hypothetical protein
MQITGKFDWQGPDVVPSFLTGEDVALIDEGTRDIRSGTMGYDKATQTLFGSTTILAARIDTLVRHLGIRVAGPRDLGRPEVMDMLRAKYYSDAPVFVVRSEQDSDCPKNNPLIKQILDAASRFKEKLPFMVSGFDVASIPDDKDGIGARIKVTTKSGAQYNHMTTSVGYASSSHGPVHFGLGGESRAQAIEIHWPSGIVQTLKDVPADRVLRVKEEGQ